MNTSKSIIRNFEQDFVAYLETDAGKFVALLRNDTTLLTYPISNDFEIRDMDIYGAYLYYCGVDRSVDRAIVGWIRIYDLYGGILNNHCYWNNFEDGYGIVVKELNKLKVVWQESLVAGGDYVIITAIGSATNNEPSESSSCVLSALIREGNTSCTWPYLVEYGRGIGQNNEGSDMNNSFPDEIFTDIAVTENYVVVASVPDDSWMNINLRVRERNAVLSPLCDTSMIITPNYNFQPSSEFPLDKFLICTIDGDILAVVSKKGLGPDQDDGYLLNLIKIDDVYQHLLYPATLSPFHPSLTFYINSPLPSNTTKLSSLCFSNGLLYLNIFSNMTPPNCSFLCEIDPFGGNVNIHYEADYWFHSICSSPWGSTSIGIKAYDTTSLRLLHLAPFAGISCMSQPTYIMQYGLDYVGSEQPDFLNRFTRTSNYIMQFIETYATTYNLDNLCY